MDQAHNQLITIIDTSRKCEHREDTMTKEKTSKYNGKWVQVKADNMDAVSSNNNVIHVKYRPWPRPAWAGQRVKWPA